MNKNGQPLRMMPKPAVGPGTAGTAAVSLEEEARNKQNRNSLFFHGTGRGRQDHDWRIVLPAAERKNGCCPD